MTEAHTLAKIPMAADWTVLNVKRLAWSLEGCFDQPCLTCISFILKKGKQPKDCTSLLDMDLKLLSKILATRLEGLHPLLNNEDETGFVSGHNSCNCMHRLLNTVQFFQQQSVDGLVIILDAEKADDRVEWPYLSHMLHKLDLDKTLMVTIIILIQ